jgi:uncharacterized membrane protein YcaP (DUF421 family)
MELHLPHNFVTGPAIEIALWGAALYLLLFALFHFVLRREVMSFGIAESLVLVLIADASQNAMAGEAISVAESAILASGMLACHLVVRTVYALRHSVIRYLRRGRRGGTVKTPRARSSPA